jgi:hypothetical protein
MTHTITTTTTTTTTMADIFTNPANIFRNPEQEQEQEQEQESKPQEQEQESKPQEQEHVQEPKPQEQEHVQEPKPQEPSICIPRVFKNTTRKDIYDTFEKLNLGAVDRIDLVPKVNARGEHYNKVFIHFKRWNNKDATSVATRDKLLKGEEIKIVYREPWFWKCTASRVEKPAFRDYSAPPPRIDLGGYASLSAHQANK